MLQTQVNYWTLMETKRHNIASEELGWATLAETGRHNVATEEQGWANIEIGRGNLNLGFARLGEDIRHNKVQEDIGYKNVYVQQQMANAALSQAAAANQQAATAQRSLNFQVAKNKIDTIYNRKRDLEYVRPLEQYKAETERMRVENEKNKTGIQGFQAIIPFLAL